MPFIDIPGRRVHSLQAGSGGDPVVALHGVPETSHQWRHQLASAAGEGARRPPHPVVAQFGRYFPRLRSQPIEAGHFLGEEAPAAVDEALVGFLRSVSPRAAGGA